MKGKEIFMINIRPAKDMKATTEFWSKLHKEALLKRLEPTIERITGEISIAAIRGEDYVIVTLSDDEEDGSELIINLFKEKGYIMKSFRPTPYEQLRYLIKW